MKNKIRRLFKEIIPGIISGGADNDPAGITTYSISGAQFGYGQLWLMVLATPMLVAVQAMCARLGDVKRVGLMTIMKQYFPRPVIILAAIVLIITNTATLTADLTAIADVIGMVSGIPYFVFILPVSLILWYLIVYQNYRILEKYLLFLTFIFLCYVVSAFLSKPDWGRVIREMLMPVLSVKIEYFVSALGLLGTTITPSLFIWQSKQELEEHKRASVLIKQARREDSLVAPGFIYSNFISLFIMISTASVLYNHGITNITSSTEAAMALEPLAGSLAKWLFAIGIIGSGLIAVPVFATSTAYVIAEVAGWKDSLSVKFSREKGFYGAVTITMILACVIAFLGIKPMSLLLYSQVLNGILAPFLVILILILSNRRDVVGVSRNGWFDNIFGVLTVFVMIGSTVGFLAMQFIR